MLVKVTQEHIDKGRQNIASAGNDISFMRAQICPVSLALKEVFKVSYAKTGLLDINVGIFPEDNLIFSKETPQIVYEWIREFDSNVPVQPFEFELSLEGVKL